MWSQAVTETARTVRLALASWSHTARGAILLVVLAGCLLFLMHQGMPLITW